MPLWGSTMCPSTERVDGKTIIVTGANTGIGKETVRELVERGARVIVACRDVAKAQATVEDIAKDDPEKLKNMVVQKLDLASMASIRQFAEKILETEEKIDILINNAGIMMCPEMKTEDGFEMQFGVNHLGHFLLTNLLLQRIKDSAPSRIINVSSNGHLNGEMHFNNLMLDKEYGSIKAYCQSKLANILFSKELTRRLEGTGVTTYSVHPGAVDTELQRHLPETMPRIVTWFFRTFASSLLRTPTVGAQTSIYCAVAEELKDKSGLYYVDCSEKEPSGRAKKMDDAKTLWEMSCDLVDLENVEVKSEDA